MSEVEVRRASVGDAAAIARVFNEGIAERGATFETAPQEPARFEASIEGGEVVLVGTRDGDVVAAAWVGGYADDHDYYAGVGEATLYVAAAARRSGVGREILDRLADEARGRGYHKLVGKLFTSNHPSLALLRACGWDEVGVHRRHGQLDGEWKDVLVVERLLGAPAAGRRDMGPRG